MNIRGWAKREIGRLNEHANKCYGASSGSTGHIGSAYLAFAKNMQEGVYDDVLQLRADED